MLEQLFRELTLRHILVWLLILAAFIALAWLFHFFLRKVAKKLAHKTRTHLDDALVSTLEKPVLVAIILVGVYLAILSFPIEAVMRQYVSQGLGMASGLLGIYIAFILFDVVLRWYRQEVMSKGKRFGLTGSFLTLFRATILIAAVLLAVLVVLGILGISSAPVTGWLGQHGWRIIFIAVLSTLAIIVISEHVPRLVARTLARRAGETEEESSKQGETLSRVLVSTGQIVVLLIAAFMVLSELEINIAPILAGVGVAGIAIGFGAQSLVKDIVNGLFIVFENQYRVGDFVRIAEVDGLVEDVNLRRTVLRNFDGTVHVVPNGEIRVASNYTKEWARVNMNVSVAYGEDLDHVISVINRVCQELSEDAEWAPSFVTPPQVLGVDKLGDSGIEIKILGDTKPMRPWAIMRELRLRLKKAFDKEGIEIPWPHTKVYFGNSPTSIRETEEPGAKPQEQTKT